MQKIKREIAKLISNSGDCCGASWEELEKIDKLVNLFKSYARSLVPDMQHYDNDDVKNPDLQFRVICAYKDGYNACREEILNKIDKE